MIIIYLALAAIAAVCAAIVYRDFKIANRMLDLKDSLIKSDKKK